MFFWESQDSLTVLQWMLRAVVMFSWLLFVTKLMGQRELGHLNAFDFIVAFTLGGTVSGVLNNSKNGLIGAMTTTTTLAGLNIIISYIALKNAKIRRIFQDEPIVIVQNGRIIDRMMRKARYNLDDLLQELRLRNITNLHDVEFAIIESNGKLSAILKSQARPIQPKDLGIATKYEGMATILIEDGKVVEDNLKKSKLDISWLSNELKKRGINSFSDVYVATLNTQGELYISKKNERYIH